MGLPTRLALVALILSGGGALAHIRLHVTGDPGKPLKWSNGQNIGIVINATGSDDVTDGSHFTALRQAIASWNSVAGSNAHLVENTNPVQQARADWGASSLHLVWFDEDNSSGFFPGSSGTVAITPVLFDTGDGEILDADVLYNGKDHSFTTKGEPNRFDIQDIGAHELGHFLGLDHTGWGGATMYPYVSPSVILHRSLASDEHTALREIYPSQAFGRLTGTVRRASTNAVIPGAHLTVRDATTGRTAAGTLARSNGTFTIEGLEAGTYEVIAHPLKGVVGESNLQAGKIIETNFDATSGPPVVVALGSTVAYGDLVAADPPVSQVMDVVLGTLGAALPRRVVSGTNNTGLYLGGNGLAVGSTLTVSDPDLTLSNVVFTGTAVSFAVDVPAGAPPGHVDLFVSNANGSALLPAALEITPPDPVVTQVAPPIGSSSGGTLLTLSGTGFRPGARVVVGPRIYSDGDPGVTVVDETTITLATQATSPGTYDVVVVDESGVEGRAADGFQFSLVPAIATVFPPAGSTNGGTELVIMGQDFAAGATVEIDGVVQNAVTFVDASRLCVATEPKGVPIAGAVLRVTIPGGAFAESAFTYTTQPDPVVAALSPASGPIAGGTAVTISGSGFTNQAQVRFGVELDGSGGTPAAALTFVDPQTLEVTTPAFTKGSVRVLVQDAMTGQAELVEQGFSFQSKSSGGGGGCSTAFAGQGPGGLGSSLLASAWFALLLLALCGRLQRARLARAPRSSR